MTIIDSADTYVFKERQNTFLIEKTKRINDYKIIDKTQDESNIGIDQEINIKFYELTESNKSDLEDVFILNEITSISNIDEVEVGEDYITLTGVTNNPFIISPKNKPKFRFVIEKKGINFYNFRMSIRFDTKTINTKV